MEFEWDEDKRLANIGKHNVDFVRAVAIFAEPIADFEDSRFDYGEARRIAIGFVGQDCYVIVYTIRADVLRIISARIGGRRDQRKYQTYFAG